MCNISEECLKSVGMWHKYGRFPVLVFMVEVSMVHRVQPSWSWKLLLHKKLPLFYQWTIINTHRWNIHTYYG